MSCCEKQDCEQGKHCPQRRAASIAHALVGYGAILAGCVAAVAWLAVMRAGA